MKVRVASAGTGKTTSLVLRYLELIASGTPLRRIAGATFTRAAAAELRARVGQGVLELLREGRYLEMALPAGGRARFEEAERELAGATITTIHGFMIESLRLVAPLLGLDPSFGVLGEWEARAIFEEEVRSLLFLAREPQHGLHPALEQLGDEAEALLLSLFAQRSLVERFESDEHPTHRALERLFAAVYRRYEARLGAGLLPPGEVERRSLKLARTPKALERLAARYRVVLVDEFQDVNPLQGAYFAALERAGMAIEAVGDPKQSIYGFRNADVEVFRQARAAGEELPPLTHSRRHARVVCRFLNRLTETLAASGWGFGPDEAPQTEVVGPQAAVAGRLELHWVTGEAPIAALRRFEARVLAERLRALNQEAGYPYQQMAVLARTYDGLAQVEAALEAAGVPAVLLQGRGYFERSEIRDLYHALHVGVSARGLSLAAWLRGPFGQLPLASIERVMRAEDPEAALAREHPEVHARLERVRLEVRGTPAAAIKFLIREPFIGGKRYVEFLDGRARENVDALLFTVAEQPPGDLELLLARLERLSRQDDAGDVPQSGEGVQLLTVHKAKGLEWPLVAVFDLGRRLAHQAQQVYLAPGSGALAHHQSPRYAGVQRAVQAREEAEGYRLLYVAASRARDALLFTGSVKAERPEGWLKAMSAMGLCLESPPYEREAFALCRHPYGGEPARATRRTAPTAGLEPASYLDRRFPHALHPPVQSPSRLKGEAEHEPLPFADPDEGERLPGRATTVGTLVHYAISQNWRASVRAHLANLRAQEVMFPYSLSEQDEILEEVALLLGNYESLLGCGLAPLAARSEDHPELPMALPLGATVWQGIIDRLYCANGSWYLEDYKTDQEVRPESYHVQLGVYLRAIRAVRGVTPQARLVYLRPKQIVPLEPELLLQALEQAL